MKQELYRQCKFVSNGSNTTGYIPDKLAKIGNVVTLEDHEGLWTIVWVSAMAMPKDAVKLAERGYKDFQGSTRGGGIDA